MIPYSEILLLIRSTAKNVNIAYANALALAGEIKDSGVANEMKDCVELLDHTVDALAKSQSVIENQNGEYYGTGNRNADLKAWSGAAYVDLETCIESFEGAKNLVKDNFIINLKQIKTQVSNLLGMVHDENGHNTKFSYLQQRYHKTPISAHVVVAKDGSGDFTSIKAAVLAAPDKSKQQYVIHIKKGLYKENVEIKKNKRNLMLVGEGMDYTIISGRRNFVGGWRTYDSATLIVGADRFIAQNLTIENTAGLNLAQAVAVRTDSDLTVFYKCRIKSYQDALYVHTGRQFYRECQISGTTDFIFGEGPAVFQNCTILVRNGHPKPYNTITAHRCSNDNVTAAFSFQFCNISADTSLISSGLESTYLGRPWRPTARTVFMQSYMSDIIRPEGWIRWDDSAPLDKLYYGEYMNSGLGAILGGRVKWPGYHVMDKHQAKQFTVAKLLDGKLWLPSTGIDFTPGLEID
ncbi:hypothetical protein IFM89_017741 [Coptis chinensis]|uniref:Pectinesterase n=1 Tax=Coptis chinensis TaxID=261450 RepID=A0A835HBP0_9MAGN|nr:hypothetical protein IFM89_017741 [Coptis chinensis]